MTDITVTYSAKAMQDPDYAVEKAVDSWQAARKWTQVACVSVLANLYLHSDTETTLKRANRLVTESKGANSKALVEWFVLMGFSTNDEGFIGCPDKDKIKQLAGNGYDKAKALHWWDLKPQKPFEGWDDIAAARQLLKKAADMQKKAEESPELASKISIHPEFLTAINEAMAKVA